MGSLGAGDWGFVRIVSLDDDEMACHGFTLAGFAADVERVIQPNDGRAWMWYLGRLLRCVCKYLPSFSMYAHLADSEKAAWFSLMNRNK